MAPEGYLWILQLQRLGLDMEWDATTIGDKSSLDTFRK